MASKDKPL